VNIMGKIDGWKLATILLCLFCICLFILQAYRDSQKYNFDGLEINKKEFYSLSQAMNEEEFFLCSIPHNKCVIVNKIE